MKKKNARFPMALPKGEGESGREHGDVTGVTDGSPRRKRGGGAKGRSQEVGIADIGDWATDGDGGHGRVGEPNFFGGEGEPPGGEG